MKKINVRAIAPAVLSLVAMFVLGGCYTQVGSVREEPSNDYSVNGERSDVQYSDSGQSEYNDPYYDTYESSRQRFYYDYYYPSTWSIGFSVGSPWWYRHNYWGWNTWGWYDPYYDNWYTPGYWFPYSGYYSHGYTYRPVYYGGGTTYGGVYRGRTRTTGVTRDGSGRSGSTTGYVPAATPVRGQGPRQETGTTPGAYAPRTPSATNTPAATSRPGVSTGRQGTRSVEQSTPPSRGSSGRTVDRGRGRSDGGSSHGGNSGGGRSYTPPAQSSPPPSHAPSSGGNSGGSSSNGGSRGGTRR